MEGGRRLAEAFVKQLTGQDTITARMLYKEFFDFKPAFKIFLAANHKPTIRGTDHAIWRRIRLVPFTVTIPPEERDRNLPSKLRGELPGILAWAVRGCLDWQAHGLGEADAVRKATGTYRDESDMLATFFAECCVINASVHASAKSLYAAYTKWCEESGERAESQRALGLHLAERGFEKVRREHGIAWQGIGLQTTEAEP
jgi:putative DNA primase/helicase